MSGFILLIPSILMILVVLNNLLDNKIPFKEYLKMGIITYLFCLIGLRYEWLIMPVAAISIGVQLKVKGKNLIESIIHPLLSVIICFVSNNVAMYLLTNVINIGIYDIDIYRNSFLLYMLSTILIIVTGFLISKIVGLLMNKSFAHINKYITFKTLIPIVVVLIITIAIFLITMFGYNFKIYTKEVVKFNLILYSLYFVVVVVLSHTIFTSIINNITKINEKEKLKNLSEYTKSLEAGYEEMRRFRHDYINILTSIGGHVENEDIEGLKAYLQDKIIPLNSTFNNNNLTLSKLKNIQIGEVKAIIGSKLLRAQELGIQVSIEILDQIENIDMDIIDLCRTLGIILDNAIEGAMESSEPTIKFAVIKGETTTSIIVENSCEEHIPNINKLCADGYSTKGSGRGLGLGILKSIVSKHENIFNETKINKNEFSQTLDIINKSMVR